MTNRLHTLSDTYGQSAWLDNLRREDLRTGALQALVAQGIRGVTSNPTIFQNAFAGSSEYDVQLAELFGHNASVEAAFWAIAEADATAACILLAGVFDQSGGTDGFVSLEVPPELAHDAPSTTSAARLIHQAVSQPNLMVKIPSTTAGLESIRDMIAEGRSINATLIFGLERYDQVIEAYLTGLETFAASGARDLSNVASVASFFVSRVDVEVDKRLAAIGTAKALSMQGKAAVAQAVLAYQLALKRFSGTRWNALTGRGAQLQRPLWASTSVKNPALADTFYVDSLIGPDTVSTMPATTLTAFIQHGTLLRTLDTDSVIVAAHQVWDDLHSLGIDMHDVANVLEVEGVASFTKSFSDLFSTLHNRSLEFA
jgi:transaldolase